MAVDEIVERLRTLEVFSDTLEHPNSIREHADIFEKCTTLEAIRQEAVRGHWGCGSKQFVYFHLRALLKKELEYKSRFLEEAKQQLGNCGISAQHIDDYFEFCPDPGPIFIARHGRQYNADVIASFYEKTDQFALDKIREWLGFK